MNNTIQDVIARFKRMTGHDVLWLPGTDHAGISTQSVVKKHLHAEGVDWKALGRDKMVDRIWAWKEQFGETILNQLRRLGASCDWDRTRFTMDESLSLAVRTAFKRLYDAGLIYRGKYIVNWCPIDQTALSDDEIETKEGGVPGFLWYFKYPLSDGSGHLTVATTRPETMLGDTAVAVHSQDERYRTYVGKELILPLVGRRIPVIADDFVDPEFGTGCVKVTPAHDANDFEIGRRHHLPQINIMNPDASMNENVPEAFRGMDRFECREAVVQALKDAGVFLRAEERMTPVGRCQRSKAMVEYRLSDQWFVKMKPLAEAALEASDQDRIAFYPGHREKDYRNWLNDIRDWCISRQLWWGHRIPAWYHKQTGEIRVDIETPAVVSQHPGDWTQDEDVLDTWFSSALWPYSTLGWPNPTADLKRYFPTNVLVTAKDIIFFWVARMVMTSLFNTDRVPFHQVLINPIILDENGETMSKSKGNGIDPLHVIDGATLQDLEGPIHEARPHDMAQRLEELRLKFPNGFKSVGADALRYTLLSIPTDSQQFRISLKGFKEIGRPMTDKIWNGSRLILDAIASVSDLSPPTDADESTLADQWILGRLDRAVETVKDAYENYAFHQAIGRLGRFFKDDLCDWYLELAKHRLRDGQASDQWTLFQTLSELMSSFLRMIHPIMPFISEELWGHFLIKVRNTPLCSQAGDSFWGSPLCAGALFPESGSRWNPAVDEKFRLFQAYVKAVRNLRAEAGIKPSVDLDARVLTHDEDSQVALKTIVDLIVRTAGLKSLQSVDEKPTAMSMAVVDSSELYVDLASHRDVRADLERAQRELVKVDKTLAALEKKLSNPGFLANAPDEEKQKQNGKYAEALEKQRKLQNVVKELSLK